MSKGGFIPLGGGSLRNMFGGGGEKAFTMFQVLLITAVYLVILFIFYKSYTAATAQLAVLDTKNKVPIQYKFWTAYTVVK